MPLSFSSGWGALALFQPDTAHHVVHHLLLRQVGGVDDLRVLSGPQGVYLPVHVLIVPLDHVGQHFFVGTFLSLLLHFVEAAAGANLRRGGQVKLHRGVRQNPGADVPAVQQHTLAGGKLLLPLHHGPANHRSLGDGAGGHADLRCADQAGHILPVHIGVLFAVFIADFRQVGRRQRFQSGFIFQSNAFLERFPRKRAVHGSRIQMQDPQLLGHAVGHGAFARADRAVQSDCKQHRSSHPFA